MIIERILGRIDEFDIKNLRVDPVRLDHLEMSKSHQRVTSAGGLDLAVSLPRGVMLYAGAVLYADKEMLVAIELVSEDILEIKPKDNLEWARASFNIGNMHHPAYFTKDCIQVPYDSLIENLVQTLDVAYTRCRKPLDGMRANVTNYSHQHGHHHQ